MSLTTEQYIALSALVYTDYPETTPYSASHPTIQTLIANSNDNSSPIKDYLGYGDPPSYY